jgi:hypothetical protein
MLTPVVVELSSRSAREQRQAAKTPNERQASRSAAYLPYRHRRANSTVGVASTVVGRDDSR